MSKQGLYCLTFRFQFEDDKLKPFKVIFAIGLILLVGASGCERNATRNVISTSTSFETTEPSEETLPSVAPSETLPTMTRTSQSPTSSNLIVETLEGTSLPPIVLTQVTPEETSTPEPTVQETNFPNALIQILEPGNFSQLASPIRVQASVFPGHGNLVGLQLLDEHGRVMSDQLLKMVTTDSGWVNLVQDIKFEIPTAGEEAMIVLTTRDEFSRRVAQSTSLVFLMQIGESEINANDFYKIPFVVQSPRKESVVKGGVVKVTGFAHPYNSNPIIVELITESGGVFASGTAKLPKIAEGQNYVPFSVDIPYKVDIPTPVRLTVRQRSELLPSVDVALASVLITLQP